MKMGKGTFNDLEALKIAIVTENRGERFYHAASKKIEDGSMKGMLEDLAVQEREHAETFKALYDKALKSKGQYDDTYLFDPEVAPYLEAIFETAVFPSEARLDEIVETISGPADVLHLGIRAEKESILFYTEMVINSQYSEAKEAFRAILKEEKKHLIDLQTRLKNLG